MPLLTSIYPITKNHNFGFHKITDRKVDNSIWAFIYACCFDKIMRSMYFRSPPPSVHPDGHNGQSSGFRTITGHKIDLFRLNFMDAFFEVGPVIPMILQHDTMIYLPLATILNLKKKKFCYLIIVWYLRGDATITRANIIRSVSNFGNRKVSRKYRSSSNMSKISQPELGYLPLNFFNFSPFLRCCNDNSSKFYPICFKL